MPDSPVQQVDEPGPAAGRLRPDGRGPGTAGRVWRRPEPRSPRRSRTLATAAGSAAIIEQARLANVHPPVLHTHDRSGRRIDEVEFHPAWHTLMSRAVARRAARDAVGTGRRRARPPAPRGGFLPVDPDRIRAPVPDLDDLRRRAGDPAAPRARRRLLPRAAVHHLRLRAPPGAVETRPAGRDVDDREAGWVRCPGEHHDRDTGRRVGIGRRRVPAERAQVVHLGADERRLPHPGAGAGRADLLPAPPGAARRRAQRPAAGAAEGQAGQPVQRLGRDRVRRRDRLADRRGGPGGGHHPADGHHDPGRLRAGVRRADAGRAVRGGVLRRAPVGLRPPAGRAAGDDRRAGRSGGGILGVDADRAATGLAGRPHGRRRGWHRGRQRGRGRRRMPRCSGWRCPRRSSGCASAPCR